MRPENLPFRDPPLEWLIFDLKSVRLEDARQQFDGDPVDAEGFLIAHHCMQWCFYVIGVTDRLHQTRYGCMGFWVRPSP
jgi:hypothetical protein